MLSKHLLMWCKWEKKMTPSFLFKKFGLICVLSISQYSCSSSFEIIDRPILFSDTRVKMTKKYIEDHYGKKVDNIEITPKIIVIHYTFIPTTEGSFQAFYHQINHTECRLLSVQPILIFSRFFPLLISFVPILFHN